MLSRKKRILAEKYSKGRISVKMVDGPADEGFPPRYLVQIGGVIVAPMSMPNQGYRSYQEARRDGTDFKKACKKAMRRQK